MKKTLYILMCTVLLLTGCTQETDTLSENTGKVVLTLSTYMQYANEALSKSNSEGSESQTRTTIVSRYVIEVYTDEAYTEPANVLEDGTTHHKQQASANFALTLDKTKTYYCLLWADGDDGVYNIASLKAITLTNANKEATEAYCAKATLVNGLAVQKVTLKHAVAKVTLKDKNGTEADKAFSLRYAHSTLFNVADGTVSDSQDITRSIITAPDAEITTFYMLAPVSAKSLFSITFNYDNTGEKTVDDIPIQANYATNITGKYASVPTNKMKLSD